MFYCDLINALLMHAEKEKIQEKLDKVYCFVCNSAYSHKQKQKTRQAKSNKQTKQNNNNDNKINHACARIHNLQYF